MSDLCAPVYVVMGGDEELTFWCFVEIMNRMVGITASLMDRTVQISLYRNKISCETRAV